jgi:hypothetical protein
MAIAAARTRPSLRRLFQLSRANLAIHPVNRVKYRLAMLAAGHGTMNNANGLGPAP